jgi:glycosyltransferase involved in cell wall biosynthesis
MASYQRAHLLERSLECYRNQAFDNDRLELVVIDDHSTDNTFDLCDDWSHDTGIKTTVVTVNPKREAWRDCGAVLNAGIRASSGEYVLLTHPEVMPGKTSVNDCVDALIADEARRKNTFSPSFATGPGLYACCRVYYMGQHDQAKIDTVDWRGLGAGAVRGIDGFYEDDVNGNPDYRHAATDIVAQPGSRIKTWESWVFGGMSRRAWADLGGMLETQKWGSVDIAFHARRRALGIQNHTCPSPESIVVHQNHDGPGEVPTPRDMDVWVKELKEFNLVDPAKLMYPAVDYLGW